MKGKLQIAGAVILLLIIGWLFTNHQANANRRAKLAALQTGLTNAYDKAVASLTPRPDSDTLITPVLLRGILKVEQESRLSMMPSFIRPEDVLISLGAVPNGSTNLIIVVHFEKALFYGIDGKRGCRKVSGQELSAWPHQPLTETSDGRNRG